MSKKMEDCTQCNNYLPRSEMYIYFNVGCHSLPFCSLRCLNQFRAYYESWPDCQALHCTAKACTGISDIYCYPHSAEYLNVNMLAMYPEKLNELLRVLSKQTER